MDSGRTEKKNENLSNRDNSDRSSEIRTRQKTKHGKTKIFLKLKLPETQKELFFLGEVQNFSEIIRDLSKQRMAYGENWRKIPSGIDKTKDIISINYKENAGSTVFGTSLNRLRKKYKNRCMQHGVGSNILAKKDGNSKPTVFASRIKISR